MCGLPRARVITLKDVRLGTVWTWKSITLVTEEPTRGVCEGVAPTLSQRTEQEAIERLDQRPTRVGYNKPNKAWHIMKYTQSFI